MYAGDSWTWRVFRVVTGWVIGQCALHTVQAAALTLGLEGGREGRREGGRRAALAPALSPGANLGLARAETGQAVQDLNPPTAYL